MVVEERRSSAFYFTLEVFPHGLVLHRMQRLQNGEASFFQCVHDGAAIGIYHPMDETAWSAHEWVFVAPYQATHMLGEPQGIVLQATGEVHPVLTYGLSKCVNSLQKADLMDILRAQSKPTDGTKSQLLHNAMELVYGESMEGTTQYPTARNTMTQKVKAAAQLSARPLLAEAFNNMREADASLAREVADLKDITDAAIKEQSAGDRKRSRLLELSVLV